MLTKLTVSICLLSLSFNASACGGSNSSLMEDLLIIISFGLILVCVFILPLSIVLFNSRNHSPHTAYFIGYFSCAVGTIVLMFYASNELGVYLVVVLCLFCALPTFHALVLAVLQNNLQNNHTGKKRAAD
ncbi:hypothetical protein [Kangiella sp. M94]